MSNRKLCLQDYVQMVQADRAKPRAGDEYHRKSDKVVRARVCEVSDVLEPRFGLIDDFNYLVAGERQNFFASADEFDTAFKGWERKADVSAATVIVPYGTVFRNGLVTIMAALLPDADRGHLAYSNGETYPYVSDNPAGMDASLIPQDWEVLYIPGVNLASFRERLNAIRKDL